MFCDYQPIRGLFVAFSPIRSRSASQAGVGPHNGWSLNYPCLVGISFYSESFSRNLGLHYARREDVQQSSAQGDSNIRILQHNITSLLGRHHSSRVNVIIEINCSNVVKLRSRNISGPFKFVQFIPIHTCPLDRST